MSYAFAHVNLALPALAGRPRTVLDLGCGGGQNGAFFRRRGARVTGIERDGEAARQAASILHEVLVADLESPGALRAALRERTFDLVLLADVLEHLRDPARALAEATQHLEDGGHVIVSLPNVAAWTVRKDLLFGRFEYGDAGIMDRTHLRFFTRRSAEDLVRSVGLELLDTDLTPHLSRAVLRDAVASRRRGTVATPIDLDEDPLFALYAALGVPVERAIARAAPELLAFQHVILARKPPRPGPLSVLVGMLTMDEEASVIPMLRAIRGELPDADVVCVDSSRHDRTPELAREEGATVLRQVPPRGHGPAMERLLLHAANSDRDALLMLDCDGTYPTRELPRLRARLEEGADLVNAARTHARPAAMPLPNYLANRVFAGAAALVHGIPTVDVHSGMRAYRTSMLRAFAFDGEGDALPVETLVAPVRRGYRVEEVPIAYDERVGASKLRKVSGTVWTFARLASALGAGRRGPRRFTGIG